MEKGTEEREYLLLSESETDSQTSKPCSDESRIEFVDNREHVYVGDESLTDECSDDSKDTQHKLESGLKLPCIVNISTKKLGTCKSLDNLTKTANISDRCHLISKSSNHIVELDKDDKNDVFYCKSQELLCQTKARSVEDIVQKHNALCDESSCSEPVHHQEVEMQHINGQVLMVSESPTTPNGNLSKIFRYVHQHSRYETSQSSESVICRICHSVGDEKLIAPCKCSGSSKYVHASCLVTWFKKSVKHECELCKSDVKIRKINHNIAVWRKPEDRPVPLIWFSVFFIGLFLNILSIYVNASEYCKSTACLIFYVVNGFGIILDAAFLWFWFLKCRHYWEKWCALNQDWFIDDVPDDCVDDPVQIQFVQGCPV